MTDKETTTKKTVAKKPVAKKAVAKKPVTKKVATKKPVTKKPVANKTVTKKVAANTKNVAKPEVKAETNTAPYLTKANKNTESDSYLIPAILVLALSIVIVATFYETQFNNLMAKLGINSEIAETVVTTNESNSDAVLVTTEAATDEIIAEVITTSDETATTVETTETVTATITQVTPPKVPLTKPTAVIATNVNMRPINVNNVKPSWASANMPYTMGPAQTKAYNDMLSKQKAVYEKAMVMQQEMMVKVNEIRKAAYDRMQKNHQEMYAKLEAMHKKSMKLRYEMDQKMKAAFDRYHAI